MKYIIGLDDAGRGPVIGPMVLAGVLIKEGQEQKLIELGAKDSKLLTPKKRKLIADTLKKDYQYHAEITSPKEIDDCVNLNTLEAEKAAMIINKLSQTISEDILAIVDCPSVNTREWGNLLQSLIIKKDQIKVKAEHKADFNYPVVSAASIIAKETREDEVEKITKLIGNFGSGYPSDPSTKEFLEKNLDNENVQQHIRHSWATVKTLKSKGNQKKLF
jgi:ribonuclease HII